MPARSSRPSRFALPRRWPWLLLTAVVAACAFVANLGLHHREQTAERAERSATLFAAELRDRVAQARSFGAHLPVRDARSTVPPVIEATVRTGHQRVDDLAQVVDDARIADLKVHLQRIGRLAAEPIPPPFKAIRLTIEANRMAETADAIAAAQRRRAGAISRTTVAGGGMVLLLAVALVAAILQRSHRLVVEASHRHAQEMVDLAEHDPLTGLPNRRRLADDLDRAAAAATRDDPVQVLLCDLDGFKQLNDTLGHAAGDERLAAFAARMAAAVSPDATTYRLGGDEFCVVARPGRDVAAVVRATAETVPDADALRASVGHALLPIEAPTPHAAMRLADKRMYAAKARARADAA